jgi:hypothetical protein
MAPSRPVVYPDQIGLLIFTVAAIGGGIWAVAHFIF